jgi:hypothetical protein
MAAKKKARRESRGSFFFAEGRARTLAMAADPPSQKFGSHRLHPRSRQELINQILFGLPQADLGDTWPRHGGHFKANLKSCPPDGIERHRGSYANDVVLLITFCNRHLQNGLPGRFADKC